MTTALEGGEGSASRPGRSLLPGKTRDPLYRRLGTPQGRSGQVRKISPPPGFDPRTVQPVASRYTDGATRPRRTGLVAECNVQTIGISGQAAHTATYATLQNRGVTGDNRTYTDCINSRSICVRVCSLLQVFAEQMHHLLFVTT
jgi:hypothetical protein